MAGNTIRLHRVLRTTPERLYRAFLDPDAMVKWLPPNGFTARVHHMDARVGEETSEHSKRTSSVPRSTSTTTKRGRRGKSRTVPPSVPYEPWLIKQLKDPKEAAAYLEAVIEEGDQAALMIALRDVARAQGGIGKIARKAKLTREAAYKMLSKSGNPELRSLKALLAATGLRLAVRPIEKRAA